MKRRDLIRTAGVAGLASLLPFRKSRAAKVAIGKLKSDFLSQGNTCILIPNETQGPYQFDLSSNANMFRQDITEGNPGIPLNLTLTLVNIDDSCSPISNARIDIWHCNADGYYSEFAGQMGYLGTQSHVGETFFRGIQLTDVNGQVQFTTIYPGWYTGRAVHIHFQVFLSSLLKATSQMAFPDALNTTVNSSVQYAHGTSGMLTNSADGVFSDTANTQYEMASIAANGTGGYDASLTIGIHSPATGVINLEPETGGQFKLGVNFPNPFTSQTTIPFTLNFPATVRLELFDLQGRKVLQLLNDNLGACEHSVLIDRKGNASALTAGSYAYQITVQNEHGTFYQNKLLTIQ